MGRYGFLKKPKDSDKKKDIDIQHIRMIICHNDKKRAAELMVVNGYAASIGEAKVIIDREDGR